MPEVLQNIKSQIGLLTLEERAELASLLLESLEPDENDSVGQAWEIEVGRRVAEIRAGSATGKPAEQVFAELRERKK
jgi:putative addiction module component (TIGR02574 family)